MGAAAQQDHKDVDRLTGELAKCEEEVQMLRAGMARAQEGLAERDAALAVAGVSLAAVATKTYLRPGSGERYQQCAYCKEWAEGGEESVEHDAACPIGNALAAPALSRAVALDRARRELCGAVKEFEDAAAGVSRAMTSSDNERFVVAYKRREDARGRYCAALVGLRALEAGPAPESAP